jgi:SH3 domain-containing YSC84-like protein 1
MRRFLSSSAVAALAMLAVACTGSTPLDVRSAALVDQARITVEEFQARRGEIWDVFRNALDQAAGVGVFPGTMKAGFIVGAEYGDGLLIARTPGGDWGQPAFYTLGGGSVGLQIGGQVAEIVLVLRNRGALRSLVEDQGKLGADAEVTLGVVGAGIEGATTTNLGADVLAFSSAAGFFAGGSLEGSVLVKRNDLNAAFYGAGATPAAILFEGRFANPRADGLRTALAGR